MRARGDKMAETAEQRLAIRETYESGRQEGQRLLTQFTFDERRYLEVNVARKLINADGLEQNYHQGIWHAVNDTPLSIVKDIINKAKS